MLFEKLNIIGKAFLFFLKKFNLYKAYNFG